jgi:2-oxoglutarate dehydrogenase complex dehydrogenase (E1) component-like enzyme
MRQRNFVSFVVVGSWLQVYYKLSQVRRGAKVRDIVLVRLEMIAPFPHDLLTSVIANYENADIVWCQVRSTTPSHFR